MAFRVKPRDESFYRMISDAGRTVADSAAVLMQLLDPAADRSAIASQLRELEHVGDSHTHQILRQLNISFVTSFDSEDIYRLAGRLDDVIDAMDEVTDFIDLAAVGELPSLIAQQIRLLERSSDETAKAMAMLATPSSWSLTGSR